MVNTTVSRPEAALVQNLTKIIKFFRKMKPQTINNTCQQRSKKKAEITWEIKFLAEIDQIVRRNRLWRKCKTKIKTLKNK